MPCLPRGFTLGLALLCAASLPAAETGRTGLPEPLSLDHALSLVDGSAHPALLRADALMAGAQADRAVADAEDGLELGIVGSLKWIKPARTAADQGKDDSYVKLDLRKRLYDSGQSEAGERAAEAGLEGSRHRQLDALQQRRLEVMRRFFAVLLADLQFAQDSEAMAVAFVRLDKARDRADVKQVAEIEVLALDHEYQNVRQQASLSTNRQRSARSALAIALNRPGELSAELKYPDLAKWHRPLPELERLSGEVLANNPLLRALRAEVKRERELMERASSARKPVVTGSLGADAYRREMGGYNPLEAELTLEIPLYTGGRAAAEGAKARSQAMLKAAELESAELELRQRLTDLWLELQQLDIRKEGLAISANYRGLKLDRNRALYEMEVNTDLGDAMVDISRQKLEQAQADFRRALIWAEIDALNGRLANR